VEVRRDWYTGTFGIRVGDLHNAGEAYVREREDLREEAEQKRLFYVAATRARERLVLGGARTARSRGGSFLSLLEEAAGAMDWETPGEAPIALDGASLARVLDTVDPSRTGGDTPLETEAAWPDPAALLRAWEARRAAGKVAAILRSQAPSRLGGDRHGGTAGALADASSRDDAAAVGTAAHRILARLDFADPARSLARLLDPLLDASLPPRLAPRRDAIRGDLEGMLRGFLASDVFAVLARSRILGREVPCLVPAQVGGARVPIDGAIDLILDRADGIVVLDYKTDRLDSGQERARAEAYREQGAAYVKAASAALGRPVAFEVLFLRTAESVRVAVP
jgi:ATP-dependent helicase/nuclease subunit A